MSDDNLSIRVQIALGEADEILHRDGAASYIDTVMSCAANHADYAAGCDYFGIAKDYMQDAEREAAKAGRTKDVVQALIRGYERASKTCLRSYQSKERRLFADKCIKRVNDLRVGKWSSRIK